MPQPEPESTPQDPTKFYLTTPIYYVNARPHIGHAYTTIVADVLARRHRLLGHDTFFLTGTDEHGQKIERSAAAAGIPPQQFADQVSQSFRDLWDRMGLTYDRFLRTTSDPHKQGAQRLFAELFRLGHIDLSSYTGSYCVSDEAFVDLPPGTPCPDCGRPLETVTEENFFFRLSAFQLPLLNLIESNTLTITPEASRNEVLSFLRGDVQSAVIRERGANLDDAKVAYSAQGKIYLPGALKDLSVSRSSFTWGIPVPEPAASLTQAPHVIYVWLDALANYMTAIGYGNPDPAAQQEFRKWWPADLHLVGKEITRFHCVYWPAFLLALNPATAASPSATQPEGAPFMAQSDMSGNVNPPTATSWATPQAEWSPEEHGLPPESPTPAAPANAAVKGTASAVPSRPATNPVSAAEDGPAMSWATPEAEVSPEEHGLPPEPQTTPATHPERADHAAWATHWLPKQINANGWLLFDNSKMSKSKGNVVRTETILDAFGQHVYSKQFPDSTKHDRDLFAADVLRYYLLREIPFGQDGSFSFEALVTRYNADLANGYGNLVSRTLKMVQQYFAGDVPSLPTGLSTDLPADEMEFLRNESTTLASEANFLPTAVDESLSNLDFAQALQKVSVFLARVDTYITALAPWRTPGGASDENVAFRRTVILSHCFESLRILTALLHPILPHATASVWAQLGLGSIESAARNGDLRNLQWGGLRPGTKLGPLGPIFPRADKSLIETMTNMEISNTPALNPITDNNDRTQPDTSPFPEGPLASAAASTPVTPSALTDELAGTPAPTRSFDPAAGPRTSTLPTPNSGATVAGSHAITTERPGTPSHTEATPSGIFAGGPIPVAPTLSGHSSQPVAQSSSERPADQSPEITIDDFAKIDLRVAQILVCERIPKADKLLRLEVDLGPDLGRRQILSGIAEHYTPESLIGRRIIVVVNLAPRKMRGLESHGMLLAANGPEVDGKPGKPILATTAEDTPLGSRLK